MKRVTMKRRILSMALVLILVVSCFVREVGMLSVAADVINAGTMSPHANGYSNGIYFTMAANSGIPYNTDWSTRYKPTTADAIQRTRGGETQNVGNTGAETLVKFGETDWFIENWAIGGAPQDGDVYTVNGQFVNESTGVTISIETTYIEYSGGVLTFTVPAPSIGNMKLDENHTTPNADGGFYFKMNTNDVPYNSDWSVRYKPTTADAIQRIREGVTSNAGNTGAETLVKYSETEWFVEGWAIGGAWQDGDILIVDGIFENTTNGARFQIDKTYIYYKDGSLTFSTIMPETSVELNAGHMNSDTNNPGPNDQGAVYFTMENNAVPYESGDVRYKPTSADAVKLIRNGNTTSIGHTEREMFTNYSDNKWILEGWTLVDLKPWTEGDVLVVEGTFNNADNNVSFSVEKTYILYKDGKFTFSTKMPVFVGSMNVDSSQLGPNDQGSVYFTMENNAVSYENVDVRYKPTSADAVKLIRNGNTTSIGHTERETFTNYGDNKWILEGWTLVDLKPWTEEDILLIDGVFINEANGTTLVVEKTYILYKDGKFTFSTKMPVFVGSMNVDSSQLGPNDQGAVYFTMENNAVSYENVDVRYKPTSADAVKLIRNGNTTSIGHTEREMFTNYGDNKWILEGWTLVDLKPWTEEDILLIDGVFINEANGTTLVVDKTYILYKDGKFTFSTKMPVFVGSMNVDSSQLGPNDQGAVYFTMENNAVPYESGDVRYKPTSADAVKLIRNGNTTSIGHTEREMFTNYGDNKWILEGWTLVDLKPWTEGDILLIDGVFINEANGTTLVVDKTYILYYNGRFTFTTTEPIFAGPMQEHKDGYNENGIFFSTEANEFLPSEAYYNPVTTGTMVLIRDGVEEEIGHSGRETLYKKNDTEWVLQGWTIGGIANMKDGDIIKIDGQFKNETYGVTFTMKTSYIVYRDGQVVVSDTLPQIVDVDGVTSEKTDATVTVKMNLNVAYNDVDSAAEVSAFLAGAKIGDVTLQSLVDAGYATITFTENTASKKHPTTMTIVFTAAGYATIDNFAISFESMNYTNGTVNYSGNATTFARWIEVDGRAGFSSTDLVHLLKTTDGSADGSSMISKDINQDGYKDEMDEYWTRRILVGDSLETIAEDLANGMPTTNPNNEMTIGVWNGSYHSFGTRDFNVLSEAEIDLIIGVDERYSNGMGSLLDKAEAANIDVLAYFSEWDSSTVPDWATKNALRGFLMADEPTAKWKLVGDADLGGLVDKQEKFNQLMPAGKEYYINLMAQSNAFFALYGDSAENFIGNMLNYNDNYVKQFTKQLSLETLAFDSYGMIEENGTRYLRPSFYDNFAIIANAARDEGAIMQYTFCSAGHDSTDGIIPTPTADELRWQMNLGLTFGATELAHYVYTSHEDDYQGKTMVDINTNKTTYLYDNVKQVNHEMKQWDELILNYTWNGTQKYDVEPTSTALSQINTTYSGSARTGFTTTQDMLVGNYANGSEEAFMVTNAGQTASENPDNKCAFTMTSGDVTMTFAENYDRVAIVREGKTTVYFLDDNNAITFEVDAYEGVFVVPFEAK